MLRSEISRAKTNVKRALELLPKGSPEHIRALDIDNELAQLKATEDS